MALWVQDVLKYWFDDIGCEYWFNSNADIDQEVSEKFLVLWKALHKKNANHFMADAQQSFAAIILFDQFPRNMFRGHAMAFKSDPLALDIAKLALAKNYDEEFPIEQRHFFYMPFMHSENIGDQNKSLALFGKKGFEDQVQYAVEHHKTIVQFNRFPHRNIILERKSTIEEERSFVHNLD